MTPDDAATSAPRRQPQPVAPAGTGERPPGTAVARIDGPAKVTGRALYAAEHDATGLAHAVVVNATVARGRIVAIDVDDARRVPGVIDVLTHDHRPKMRSLGVFYKDMISPGGTPLRPLHDDRVHYSGQPVAVVVADTFEAARDAARRVVVRYDATPHETDLLAARDRARDPSRLKAGYEPPPSAKGDAPAAFDAAPVKVDTEFHAGVEHHNPMEMHAATVIRGDDGHLTIHDKTQGAQNSRWTVSRVFGLPERKVTVKNGFVGGAFGSGLRPNYALILAVLASNACGRSVRLVLTRQQMFTFGHRPQTWQRLRLAAERDGRLVAILHEAVAETSRLEDYVEVVVNWSGQLYACDNVQLGYRVVELDHASPMDMRAPGAAHGVHALEVAMDELAYAVGVDPLALRLKNHAQTDPATGKPYSTKSLLACYEQGAARFGWSRRPLAPRSMRDGNEWVGWGMATGMWDAMTMFARARAVLSADGSLVVESAASDIGTGTYTAISQIAAAAMGLPLERVTFRLGDSTLPVAPVEGGSAHLATVGSAVDGACERLKRELWSLARCGDGSPLAGTRFRDVECVGGTLRVAADPSRSIDLGEIVRGSGLPDVQARYLMLPNLLRQRRYTRAVHSAVFCEVRVDEELGQVRVTRVVSAVAAGRIVNPTTATSQVMGGVVWGLSQALFEETHCDHALGRFMNHSLAEYHVAASADVGEIDVVFVPEDDRIVSRIGVKGVGEIGIVGVAAAVSNAIFHATGRRLRTTPMTPDKVMAGGSDAPLVPFAAAAASATAGPRATSAPPGTVA